MFGSFLQSQVAKQNNKITIKKQNYELFRIPIQKIKAEKHMVKKINQQCQKLKSELKFITEEINRENQKKRTHNGYNIRNSLTNSCIFKQMTKNTENKQTKKQEKDIKIDLANLMRRVTKNKFHCSESLRKYQQSIRNPLKEKANTNRL